MEEDSKSRAIHTVDNYFEHDLFFTRKELLCFGNR
jgi:hypothetical protein